MSYLDSLINGALAGLGMWVMMTVLGLLTYLILKNRITRTIAKLWSDIKHEAVQLNGLTTELKFKKTKK